jgi:hypothetical protein
LFDIGVFFTLHLVEFIMRSHTVTPDRL